MSTQRGNATRQRAQKYKNRTVFKNDLHDKTPQQKKINSLHVCEVCDHCKSVIEWKIKYKKYKPLTQPKTCIKCQNRTVKKAYHVVCRDCALKEKVCAKCLKSGDEVHIEPPEPTEEEQLKLKVEMDQLIKSFPERKRRAFLRYMAKGKQIKTEASSNGNDDDNNTEEKESNEEVSNDNKTKRIPHSREELIRKIEELKIGEGEGDDDFYIDDSDLDDDDYSDEDDNDEA